VACETPGLFEYYASKAGRSDLRIISLSEKTAVSTLAASDFVVIAEGRRYFSNSDYLEFLRSNVKPLEEVNLANVIAARIYRLNDVEAAALRGISTK
jgi:hypothetical protein